MYNDLKNATNGFALSAISGSGRRLIIITGGRTIAAAGFLIAQLTDVGTVEGVDDLAISISATCATFHSALNPYVGNALPTIGDVNDQEKCLVYLNWIQSTVEATGNSTGLGGEDVDPVCAALSDCAAGIDTGTYGFMD